MADFTYQDLKHKTVDELRDIAHEHIEGSSQMRKDEIIEALCEKLNIEMKAHLEVVGIDKAAIKTKIADLKQKREAALEAKDSAELKKIRRKIHRLKREIRRHMVT